MVVDVMTVMMMKKSKTKPGVLSEPGVSSSGGLIPPNSSKSSSSRMGSTSSKHFSAEAKFETQLQRALLLVFVRVL